MSVEGNSRLAEGRTRWRRSAVLFIPSLAVVGVLTVATAEGVLAASFGVSGSNFKVTVGSATGTGVSGYLDTVRGVDGTNHPVMLAGVRNATMRDVCTSAVVNVPVLGAVSLKVISGQDGPVTGANLIADADALTGAGGTVSNVVAGQDASSLTNIPGFTGPAGRFGLQAGSLTSQNLHSTAWGATGGTVKLSGLKVDISKGHHECY